ncbi:MAG: hypothetical protein AB7S77_12350 [Desulfatirhabdiaceae bacterium]
MIKFHFIMVVWGEVYTNFYVSIILPTQLSPGNLLYVQGRSKSVYHIYTTSKDVEKIKNALSYVNLSRIMTTEIHLIDGLDLNFKYQAMAECHKQAIQRADREGCAMIFLSPDAICSDGTFMNVVNLAEKGIRAIMVAGIRVAKETFIPSFLAQHCDNGIFSISISSRQLVRIAMENLHPISKTLFWNSKWFNNGWPSHLYWKVDGEGLVARCFHMHPLMVYPTRRGVLPFGTIDDDFISLSCQSLDQIHVVDDSDEIAVCEVSDSNQWGEFLLSRSCIWRVVTWVVKHTNLVHRDFIKNKIRFHSEDLTICWGKTEHDSEDVVRKILWLAELLKSLQIYRLRSWLGEVIRSIK